MFLKTLLFPFSVVYGWITGIRNALYDRGFKPAASFSIPVISVGNLTVGGTGKTPLVEYLIHLLSPPAKVATLSRGYGRKTKGFRIAGSHDNASTIGDEPFQFYRKFGSHVTVAVGEERAIAIPLLLHESNAEVVVLDDAFQHRRVKPSLNILLCDYTRPFYDDVLLPAGRLRESKHNASRADLVVVTKCPADIGEEEIMTIEKSIREFASCPVFFSTLSYGSPVPLRGTSAPVSDTIILVTGIANPAPLVSYIEGHYKLAHHLDFRDHHEYTVSDLERIVAAVREFPSATVLTTEKDMVKLDNPAFDRYLSKIPFHYIPIAVQFLKEEGEFEEMINNHVNQEVWKN